MPRRGWQPRPRGHGRCSANVRSVCRTWTPRGLRPLPRSVPLTGQGGRGTRGERWGNSGPARRTEGRAPEAATGRAAGRGAGRLRRGLRAARPEDEHVPSGLGRDTTTRVGARPARPCPPPTPVARSTARGRQSEASCDSVAAAARAPSVPRMQPHPHAWGVAGGSARPRAAQGAAPDVTRDAGSATEPQRVFLANARGPERALRPPPPAPACRAERPSSGLRSTRPAAGCACSRPGASPRSPGVTRPA